MKNKELDSLDKRLIFTLSENGRISVGKIAKRLKITSPTIRSRIQALIHSRILKIASLIDLSKTKGVSAALVGITLESNQQLDEKLDQISKLGQVNWAAAVTGRYDIFVEVVLTEAMSDLYRFLTEDLRNVTGIRSSESFMVMKANHKWILLPRGMKNW